MLLSPAAKRKAGLSSSFFYYEVEAFARLGLPVVFANLHQLRTIQTGLIPSKLGAPLYTVSTSFQPKIIKHALDNYVGEFRGGTTKTGPYLYPAKVYQGLGL